MQQTQSPLLRLWQLGREHHGGLIAAIFCAVAGVLLGLLPYLSAGRILVALLTGQRDWSFYLLWCMVALGGYLAKTLLYNLALSLSHKATFQILRDIRKMVQIGRASCRDRVEIAGGAAAWTTKNRR